MYQQYHTKMYMSTHKYIPVRSLAKSGWFMRQWLANLTHSSLTGTWISLNLKRETEQSMNEKLTNKSKIKSKYVWSLPS